MSSPKFFELQQDRRLLKSNFDGYKLSLDPIPTLKQELQICPHRVKPTDEQYSYLHVELFSMHNHLVQDPWETLSAYFVNEHGSIQKCSYNVETGRPKPTTAVFKLPSNSSRKPGDYNISFRFVSEKFCLLCDGCNQLVLFDTSNRVRSDEWKIAFKTNISEYNSGFVLREARLDISGDEKNVNFILHRIYQATTDGEGNQTELLWYTLVQKEKIWKLEYNDTFRGKGSINYCALEPKSGAVILSSCKRFKSVLEKEEEKPEVPKEEVRESKEVIEELSTYSWTQTDDDLTIRFGSRPEANKTDYKVTCSRDKILVKCKDEILLDSILFNKVDTDLTTWTMENNFLQLTLVKDITALPWPHLTPGGPAEGAELQEDSAIEPKPPVANLEAQMEECDDPMQANEEEYYIDRLDLSTKKSTHRALLGSRAPLFSTCLRPGFPAAIVTRQDVDACLWLLNFNLAKLDEWSFRHEGTLHAFGYVEASKQQKKFVNCSPDLNYAVICESFRHVFIYRSDYDTANGLRNRNGPAVSIGKQHLVTLEDAGEVLGMTVDNFVTILLTEKFLIFLQINAN